MNPEKPKSLVDQFYAHPTPEGAVALSIADHLAAHKFPMWEYVGELRTAEKQVRAYPSVVAALKAVVAVAQPIPTRLGPPMTEPETRFSPAVEAASELLESLDAGNSPRDKVEALLRDFEKRLPIMAAAIRDDGKSKRTRDDLVQWLEIMTSQVQSAIEKLGAAS